MISKTVQFLIKLPDSIFDVQVYKYLKDGYFYDAGGFQSAKSAYNFQHEPMKLWEVQLNFAVHCATSGLDVNGAFERWAAAGAAQGAV